MQHFENKVVWITGASSGIGEALAYTLAKHKAKLILSARRADELERVKQACKLPDADVLLLPMDVSAYTQMYDHVLQALKHFGHIDVLVNNAGMSHWSKLKDTSLDVVKRIMDVNFMGAVGLTHAVLPSMLQRKQGQIIVISSILGKMITPKQGVYNASKHALMGYFDTLRTEVKGEGVKVLIVCPGFVRTNVAKNSLDKHGNPINKDNNLIANGIDPLVLSEDILSAVKAGKEEVILAGGKEKFAVLMKRFAPGLFSKFISGQKIG